jgi:hypothetical protein
MSLRQCAPFSPMGRRFRRLLLRVRRPHEVDEAELARCYDAGNIAWLECELRGWPYGPDTGVGPTWRRNRYRVDTGDSLSPDAVMTYMHVDLRKRTVIRACRGRG